MHRVIFIEATAAKTRTKRSIKSERDVQRKVKLAERDVKIASLERWKRKRRHRTTDEYQQQPNNMC